MEKWVLTTNLHTRCKENVEAEGDPTSVNAGFHIAQLHGWESSRPKTRKGSNSQSNRDEHAQRRRSHQKLTAMEQYQKMFASAFPNDKSPITYDNLAGDCFFSLDFQRSIRWMH